MLLQLSQGEVIDEVAGETIVHLPLTDSGRSCPRLSITEIKVIREHWSGQSAQSATSLAMILYRRPRLFIALSS